MKIAITGCCVSRDTFNYDLLGNYEISKFVQLNPISCLKSKKCSGGGSENSPRF